MAGLDKGVKRLSDITILATLAMLAFMILAGPTRFILTALLKILVTMQAI